MQQKKEKSKKLGRYQQKVRQGLVPSHYDKNSKAFQAGAHRHWPSHIPSAKALAAEDARFLQMAREAR